MISIDKWLPDIYLGAPGVPEAVARHYIARTLSDFATRTQAVHRLYSVDIEPGVPDYYFAEAIPENHELIALTSYRYAGQEHQLDRPETDKCALSCGTRTAHYNPIDRSIWFSSPPVQMYPGGLVLRLAVAPTVDATEVDPILWNRFQKAIVHGVLADLQALVGFAWSSLPASRNQMTAYHAACNAGKLAAMVDHSTRSLRIRRGNV